MLIPREKPHLAGLNSYYLDLEKFTEHLQGEIGSGCIHFKAMLREILVYFDESEVIQCIIQDKAHLAVTTKSLNPIKKAMVDHNFMVQVFYLNPQAIFFWGQLPPFQRAKAALKSSEIPLPDLIFRLKQKLFSGFIDVQLNNKQEKGLLFFHDGKRVGGSYSWGNGGLSVRDEDYNTLVSRVQTGEGIFSFGSYIQEKNEESLQTETSSAVQPLPRNTTPANIKEARVLNPVYSELRPPLEELLFYYTQALQKKTSADPLTMLRNRWHEREPDFPFLTPDKGLFEYSNGTVKFAKDAPVEDITRAVVSCAWDVIRANNAQAAFRTELKKMRHKGVMLESNIPIDGTATQ